MIAKTSVHERRIQRQNLNDGVLRKNHDLKDTIMSLFVSRCGGWLLTSGTRLDMYQMRGPESECLMVCSMRMNDPSDLARKCMILTDESNIAVTAHESGRVRIWRIVTDSQQECENHLRHSHGKKFSHLRLTTARVSEACAIV
jgi:hypothetical protein